MGQRPKHLDFLTADAITGAIQRNVRVGLDRWELTEFIADHNFSAGDFERSLAGMFGPTTVLRIDRHLPPAVLAAPGPADAVLEAQVGAANVDLASITYEWAPPYQLRDERVPAAVGPERFKALRWLSIVLATGLRSTSFPKARRAAAGRQIETIEEMLARPRSGIETMERRSSSAQAKFDECSGLAEAFALAARIQAKITREHGLRTHVAFPNRSAIELALEDLDAALA